MDHLKLSEEASKEREGALWIELEREREEHTVDNQEKLSLNQEIADL